jgi:hypothetical protein
MRRGLDGVAGILRWRKQTVGTPGAGSPQAGAYESTVCVYSREKRREGRRRRHESDTRKALLQMLGGGERR